MSGFDLSVYLSDKVKFLTSYRGIAGFQGDRYEVEAEVAGPEVRNIKACVRRGIPNLNSSGSTRCCSVKCWSCSIIRSVIFSVTRMRVLPGPSLPGGGKTKVSGPA